MSVEREVKDKLLNQYNAVVYLFRRFCHVPGEIDLNSKLRGCTVKLMEWQSSPQFFSTCHYRISERSPHILATRQEST